LNVAKANDSLTLRTKEALRRRVADGPIKAGDKLPTERELAQEFGVSRTVIREAVAALRADGLLEAKHGVGVFVSKRTNAPGPSQALRELHFTSAVLDLLELRMAVEIYAAGLAASRRSLAQAEAIWAAAREFGDAVRANGPTEQPDLRFHKSIASAANNSAFVEFFDRLGPALLPRTYLGGGGGAPLISQPYLEKSIAEHEAICRAIEAEDRAGAGEAMRAHLGQSQARYRALLQVSKLDAIAIDGAGA
jgi:GntR family transcriptional repressor for pyruvate dehydrogenase complex